MMIKIFTTLFAAGAFYNAFAQFGISDSVSMSPGYADEIYYNTQTMTKTAVPKLNWELGFQNNLMEGGIIANHNYGVTVYQCPNADIAGFSTLDTTGMTGWETLYNSENSWSEGALNANHNPADPFDFGWGNYDYINHVVNGDSVFVVKLSAPPLPDEFRKLYIQQKTSAGDYIFRYANLNNTNDVTTTVYKNDYNGKNFGYYSLRNNIALDREPLTTDWDILFTRFYSNLGPPVFNYPVTGVLSNIDVKVAKASGVDVLTVNPANYTSLYTDNISEIGYNWKTYNMSTMMYDIEDSLCYFIKSQNGNITRIVFTGFDGASTGNVFFQLQAVPSAINELNSADLKSMALYPNVTGTVTTLLFSSRNSNNYDVTIYSISGQKVMEEKFYADAGLNQKQINVSSFNKGLYVVKLSDGTEELTQKLIVK